MQQRIKTKDLKKGDIYFFFLRSKTYYLVLKVEPDNNLLLLSENGQLFNSVPLDITGKDTVFLCTTNTINNKTN